MIVDEYTEIGGRTPGRRLPGEAGRVSGCVGNQLMDVENSVSTCCCCVNRAKQHGRGAPECSLAMGHSACDPPMTHLEILPFGSDFVDSCPPPIRLCCHPPSIPQDRELPDISTEIITFLDEKSLMRGLVFFNF